MKEAAKAREFLAQARPFPNENKFMLGTFERGITVYRQQVRALNLVWAFVQATTDAGARVIPPNACIAVIGGGAFGTTVSVAAALSGFKVVLVEQHQALLHLQRGCDTRWLHPRFYDWPASESESRLARLPILDWYAASAGTVARQIQRQVEDFQCGKLKGDLAIDLGISELQIESVEGSYEVRYKTQSGQHIRRADVIVYAVGFGVETNHNKNESYWRNDRFGQSDLGYDGVRQKYVISGFGDGALVDLFRLTLHDFRYERIFQETLLSANRKFVKALDEIRSRASGKDLCVFDQFLGLESGEHREVIEKANQLLRGRLRTDTLVFLNAKDQSFRTGLSLGKVSFSNAFLAFLLFRLNAFSYKRGEIIDGSKPRLRGYKGTKNRPAWLCESELIVRHGTDRTKVLRDIDCEGAIPFLRDQRTHDSGIQLFPAGWWGQFIDPVGTKAPRGAPTPVEYVPPQLRTHATTFVSTLASVLRAELDRRSPQSRQKFRVTLHRLTRFDGRDCFQQVTPYKGRGHLSTGVGRFFPIEGGVVGLACRTGSMVVVTKTSQESFDEIWKITDLIAGGSKNIQPYVDSLFCCPFFASPARGQQKRVVLALFIDSGDPDFFDSKTLNLISRACHGFVELLESLYAEGVLRAIPSGDIGYRVPNQRRLTTLKRRLADLGVKFEDFHNRYWKAGLTFRRLKSFDLEIGYQDAMG